MVQIVLLAILMCIMTLLKDIQTVYLVPIPVKHDIYNRNGNQQLHEFNDQYILSQSPHHIDQVLHHSPRSLFYTPHNTRTLNRYQLHPRYQPSNIHFNMEPKYNSETNILNWKAHSNMAPILKPETHLLQRNPDTNMEQQFHSGTHMRMSEPYANINLKNREDFRYIPEHQLINLNRRRFEESIDPTRHHDTPEKSSGPTRVERPSIREEDFSKIDEQNSDSRISNLFQRENLGLNDDNEPMTDGSKVEFEQDYERQYKISNAPNKNDIKTDLVPIGAEANSYGVERKVATQSNDEVPFQSDNVDEVVIPLKYVDNIDGKTEFKEGVERNFEAISDERDHLKSEERSDSAKQNSDNIYVVTKDGVKSAIEKFPTQNNDRHRTGVDFVERHLGDGIASVGKLPSDVMQTDSNSKSAQQVSVNSEENISDEIETEVNGSSGSYVMITPTEMEKYKEEKTAELREYAVENGKDVEESDVGFKTDLLDKSIAQNHYTNKMRLNNYDKGIEMKVLESLNVAEDKDVPMSLAHNTGEIVIQSGISTDNSDGGSRSDSKMALNDAKLHGSSDFGVPFQMTITGLLQLKPHHDVIQI